MYKLQTQLKHFRFNSIHNHGPYTVTWFKLLEENSESIGVCLTYEELNNLKNYVANNKINFDNQNYFNCDPNNTPNCGIYGALSSAFSLPTNLIIRKTPQMNGISGRNFPCMDIELLSSNGALNHNYNLEFDIIGQIEN